MEVILQKTFIITLLAAGVRMAVPIMLAATGEIYAERSGVLNIGLEGQMLAGAFGSFIVGYFTESLILAIIAGIISGILMALLMAVACITWNTQHVVTGITLNIFALGFTSFWYRVAFGVTTTPPKADIAGLGIQKIPFLSKIPYIGEILFSQNFLFYIAVIFVILSYFIIYKTQFGLKLRASGEYPRAAETMGTKVRKMRYIAMIICGASAGLGGTFLSLISLNRFVDNITASRGFIALAIVIFGKWNPILVMGSALLFGLTDALQLRLQAIGVNVPYQLMLMLPYVLTILMMIFTAKNSSSPKSLGKNYEKEGH